MRRLLNSTRTLESDISSTTHLKPQTVRRVYYSHQHVITVGTLQNGSHGSCIHRQCAHSSLAVACFAPDFCQRDIRNEDLLNQAPTGVAAEQEVGDIVWHGFILLMARSVPSSCWED